MKEIKKITSNLLVRNVKVFKMLYKGRGIFGKSSIKEKLIGALSPQLHSITEDLGLMKGPLMKAGQMLSMYSSVLFSEDLQLILKELENSSFYLNWNEIKKSIPDEFFEKLEISERPLAAASLGQVHRAKIKETNEDIVLKIQYHGVEKAIDNDLKTLKLILKMGELIPKDLELKGLFEEIKRMLVQETNYIKELNFASKIKDLLKEDSAYYIPKYYKEFSSEKILAMEYVEGINPRDYKGSLEERNFLGEKFFELFLKEITEFQLMQTDAHMGNYLIRDNKWILLDFGASLEISDSVKKRYCSFMDCTLREDYKRFKEILVEENILHESPDEALVKKYLELMATPFREDNYNWERSSIPEELLKLFPQMLKAVPVKSPPQDGAFIDRKVAGVYFMLKQLKCHYNPRRILEKYLNSNI